MTGLRRGEGERSPSRARTGERPEGKTPGYRKNIIRGLRGRRRVSRRRRGNSPRLPLSRPRPCISIEFAGQEMTTGGCYQ